MTRISRPHLEPTPDKPESKSSIDKRRRAFKAEFPTCWFCGVAQATDTHEIASGIGIRHLSVKDRRAWAAACNDCNCNRLTNKNEWPTERQMAVKLLHDPMYFDLLAICEMRGRASTAITIADLVPYLQLATA